MLGPKENIYWTHLFLLRVFLVGLCSLIPATLVIEILLIYSNSGIFKIFTVFCVGIILPCVCILDIWEKINIQTRFNNMHFD